VIQACSKLRCQSALIDGEIIVQDKNGLSDFAALRAAIEGAPHRLVMFAFDLLWLAGEDLRRLPLIERREKLRSLLPSDQRCPIPFSEHWDGSGAALFTKACAMGLEGIVSKRALSAYRSGPSKFWLKTRNVVESKLILLGTDYDNEGKPIAYLGKVTDGELKFAGTAFLTLSGNARERLQDRRLPVARAAVPVPKVRHPELTDLQIRVRVRHLKNWVNGRDALVNFSICPVARKTLADGVASHSIVEWPNC
jgi:bifunctional non-homologous end joining protein LigD